jgi:hypothetical protein
VCSHNRGPVGALDRCDYMRRAWSSRRDVCAEAGDVEARRDCNGHVARAQGLAGGELDEEAPGGDMRASGWRQRDMGLYLRAEQR